MDVMQKTGPERAVLAGLASRVLGSAGSATAESLDELEELLKTAGGVCVAKVLQNKASPDARTMLGEGKLAEIKALAEANEATLLVCDNELSPSQFRAIEEDTGLTVLDRSGLILDIFATRARTSEGKLQVELAQYKYLLPRLSGLGNSLSRLGGGIGTRGPGESKLESDRRHIRRRIEKLEEELADVRRVRAQQRSRRKSLEIPMAAIVGYTNAGKSTLMNALTDAGIEANNRLFDTLDPTVRRLRVSDTLEVVLSDTVGFINKLPHHLVDAFRATLEELEFADLLLHVIDISNPQWAQQAAVVEQLITELAVEKTPVIRVYNKADKVEADILPHGDGVAVVSSLQKRGLDELLSQIARVLDTGRRRLKLLLPYSEAGRLDVLYRDAKVEAADYTENGILVTAVCDQRTSGWVRAFLCAEDDS